MRHRRTNQERKLSRQIHHDITARKTPTEGGSLFRYCEPQLTPMKGSAKDDLFANRRKCAETLSRGIIVRTPEGWLGKVCDILVALGTVEVRIGSRLIKYNAEVLTKV